jgi:hypothetical protein
MLLMLPLIRNKGERKKEIMDGWKERNNIQRN